MNNRGLLFETDSKSLVDAIYHLRGGNSELSLFVCHINNLLLSNPNFSIKFIKREVNMVIHTLAMTVIYFVEGNNFDIVCVMFQYAQFSKFIINSIVVSFS
jgi:hypothetical protein